MEEKDIPQDEGSALAGQKKIVYATRNGDYVAATTSGWETEDFATQQAVQALDEQTQRAWQCYLSGSHSPIYYLMYAYRHDEASLAAAAGVFRWQLRRHFQPRIFAKLPEKTLQKYAQALQLTMAQLKSPPAHEALALQQNNRFQAA